MKLVLVVLVVTGCARVSANQRGQLAAPAMQVPVWPALAASIDHVFVVREGTSGASGVGGGGCGCN